jgi:predicted GTPase
MGFGAGGLAARQQGAAELVDPRPYAIGSIRDTFEAFPHLEKLLPAIGYDEGQVHDLEKSIRQTPCDLVLIATPVDLHRIVKIQQPTCRVTYRLEEIRAPTLAQIIHDLVATEQAPKQG